MSFTTPLGSEISASWLSFSVPDAMIIAAFIYVFVLIFSKRRRTPGQKLALGLLYIYGGALIALCLPLCLPMGWSISGEGFSRCLSAVIFRPFAASTEIWRNCAAIGDFSEFWRLIGGNFVLLMPPAVLLPAVNKKYRLRAVLLTALCLSLSIELLQFLTGVLHGAPVRTVEIDDVMLNVAGAAAAYGISRPVRALFRRLK